LILRMKVNRGIRFKDEQGSTILEAALIYPIVLIILFGLISATLVLHDHYVTEASLEIELFVKPDTLMDSFVKQEDEQSFETMRIGNSKSIQLTFEDTSSDLREALSNRRVLRIKDRTTYPLSQVFSFGMDEVVVDYSNNPMNIVRQIDLMSDIFDTVTLPNEIKTNYVRTIDLFFEALESY
jgi:hypothetical protein